MYKGSSSFLKKRTKKLLFPKSIIVARASTLTIKVFWFFFSKKNCFLLLLFAASPAAASGVVSLNLCTDQLLVLLAPEHISALEPLARDPALSVVADAAKRLPSVRADAEAVLRLHPDLVLAGRYGAQTTVALLKARGLRVLQVDEPADFAQIAALITQLADALGVPGRGQKMIADMSRKLAAIHPRQGTAVLWQASGWTAGPGSLGDAVDLARHPALAAIPHRDVSARLLICGGPFTADAAALLSR